MYLINLKIKNSYAHKNTDVYFEDGLNWLLGENEGGKTELLDLVGYALTGQGLRSKASEYKSLDVQLVFRINNEIFKVVRSKTTALYKVTYENDTVKEESLATGKTAVNGAIISRLGYDYSVFSRLNYSKQLEGIALTDSKTSERLALINKINGVDEANAFEKVLEGQKKDLKSQLKALDTGSMLDNIQFQIDEDIDHLANEESINELTDKGVELYESIKDLNNLAFHFKNLPQKPEFKESTFLSIMLDNYPFEQIKAIIMEAASLHKSRKDLLKKEKELQRTLEDLQEFIPDTLLTDEQLETYREVEANNKAYHKQEELIEAHKIICPNCEHEFTDSGLVNNYLLQNQVFSENVYNSNVQFRSKYLNKISSTEDALASVQSSLEDVSVKLEQIPVDFSESAVDESYAELDAYQKYLYQVSDYEDKLSKFCNTFKVTEKDFESVATKVQGLHSLEMAMSECSSMKDKLTSYMSKKNVYELALKTQAKIDKDIAELKDKIVVIDKVIEESKKIRLEIQNNCIPVLNNIASKMINKLTGGKRYGLTMNENFELSLDGKPIDSYSGSTIVLANVAFRIALIEMFFKKSFPVFIGDEIDAYADDTRAQHIHDALVKLEKEGYQLILVSHHALNFQGNKIQLADIKNKG